MARTDLVHSTEPSNVERLCAALGELEAYYRRRPELKLQPSALHLTSASHQLLLTKFGPLDLLGMAGQGHRYSDLEKTANLIDIGGGVRVQVLNLETIIQLKEEISGAKDVANLPLLRETLRQKQRKV